jgi:hypothetical protein
MVDRGGIGDQLAIFILLMAIIGLYKPFYPSNVNLRLMGNYNEEFAQLGCIIHLFLRPDNTRAVWNPCWRITLRPLSGHKISEKFTLNTGTRHRPS